MLLTHYEVLGVGEKADSDEIKRAYQQKALLLHPDKRVNKNIETPDRVTFEQIHAAWEVLRDNEKRRTYDARLAERARRDVGVVYEEVDLDDIEYEEAKGEWIYSCRCSADIVITEADLERGITIFECRVCSARVKVLYSEAVE
ncbi:DNAJ heat shock N-terminal domain-containing protein [Cladochytrium replicatum]|nr:DNAJ heat shock N-terminal domain-containing protein [Cladochytrium replicatum]